MARRPLPGQTVRDCSLHSVVLGAFRLRGAWELLSQMASAGVGTSTVLPVGQLGHWVSCANPNPPVGVGRIQRVQRTAARWACGSYTVCHSVCIFWTHYSMAEAHCSNFRIITAIFRVSEYLGVLL